MAWHKINTTAFGPPRHVGVKLPKRVVDGEAIWTSRKLRLVEPEWVRGEFTNLLPLALANGVFELDADQIWARVYAYLRPSISRDDVSKIVAAFERSGLLFGWNAEDGKRWGFWIGIDKPGRLPRLSRVKGRHERLGPTPPKAALENYVATQWYTNGAPVVSLGFGFGLGSGTGSGENPSPNTVPAELKNPAATDSRRQKPAPGDSRFGPFYSYAFESYRTKHGRDPLWVEKDQCGLKRLLRSHSVESLPLNRIKTIWDNFVASTEAFTVKQGDSLAYFCSNPDKFSSGPIFAAPPKGVIDADTRTRDNLETARAQGELLN